MLLPTKTDPTSNNMSTSSAELLVDADVHAPSAESTEAEDAAPGLNNGDGDGVEDEPQTDTEPAVPDTEPVDEFGSENDNPDEQSQDDIPDTEPVDSDNPDTQAGAEGGGPSSSSGRGLAPGNRGRGAVIGKTGRGMTTGRTGTGRGITTGGTGRGMTTGGRGQGTAEGANTTGRGRGNVAGRGRGSTIRTSRAAKAGLQFPVARVENQLRRRKVSDRLGAGAAVFLAAVLEYLIAEMLELAGNCARDLKKQRIAPRHILLAVKNDEELNRLCEHATFSGGGVLPSIHSVLLPKKKTTNKPSQEI